MKITFIGTSAGEGYPGYWCECPNCTYAREKGGKNNRGNTCTMLDDDVCIDMNTHFYDVAPLMRIQMSRIETLLVTHPHRDHFAPLWLGQRAMPPEYAALSLEEKQTRVSPNFTVLPVLHIYGNSYVRKAMENADGLMDRLDVCRLAFHEISDGVPMQDRDIRFIPVRANHGPYDGFAHSYIIERGGKTILYASDCGGYAPDMLDIVLSHKYDGLIMEGTFGLGARIEKHMNLEKNKEMRDLFEREHLWKNAANIHLTHICPHWAPPHDLYEHIIEEEGMHLAYDGKVVEF